MSITLNTKTYSFDTFVNPSKARYVGPAQTSVIKDQIFMAKTEPKVLDATGTARAQVKVVKTVLIGTTYRDIIFDCSIAIPVGAANADVDSVRDDIGDLLISATAQNLANKGTLFV